MKSSTGEARRKSSELQKPPLTDYDKLVDLFYKRLAEQRQYNQVSTLIQFLEGFYRQQRATRDGDMD